MERRGALVWKTMHEVTNRKSTPLTKFKGSSKTERIQRWYIHFKNFFENRILTRQTLAAPFSTIGFLIAFQLTPSQFTLEELQTCIAKMSKQKSSGSDNIAAMLWKDHNFHTELLYFWNETAEGNKSSAFSKSNMITIQKKVIYTPF